MVCVPLPSITGECMHTHTKCITHTRTLSWACFLFLDVPFTHMHTQCTHTLSLCCIFSLCLCFCSFILPNPISLCLTSAKSDCTKATWVNSCRVCERDAQEDKSAQQGGHKCVCVCVSLPPEYQGHFLFLFKSTTRNPKSGANKSQFSIKTLFSKLL